MRKYYVAVCLLSDLILVLSLFLLPSPPRSAAQAPGRVGMQASVSTAAPASPPVPLPEDCIDVTPPGGETPACCVHGYVYDNNGIPLQGATVTIQGPGGQRTVTTASGELSDDPYFALALSDDPLAVRVGDTITLSADYGGRNRTVTYQVVADGQQVDLVLPADTSDTPIYYVSGADNNRQIWRMNGDGTNLTYVRPGFDPDICPLDGRVLYVYNTDIYVMDLDGSNVTNLTPESGGIGSYPAYNPDWSPDCSRIVFAAAYPGWQYKLVMMNADGSGKRLFLDPPGTADDWYPDWSPDGQFIAFNSNREETTKVFRVNADGSGLLRLVSDYSWYPVWSPDGKRIAYVGSGGDVYVINADGTNRVPLHITGEHPWWPQWYSQDWIMFVGPNATYGSNMHIYLIRSDGVGQHILATEPHYYRSPTVRPTYRPMATIHTITPTIAYRGRDTVLFRGSGQDADEGGADIVAYRWRSSLDGELSTQAVFTLTASALSTGTHTIYFQVQDDEGDWSTEVWRTLVVTGQPFDLDTLILTNQERLAALYGAAQAGAVMQKLNELAAATNGLVLRVEEDPATAAAYDAWLAEPTGFQRANAVADAIHDQIVAHLGLSPDLAYLVIVGDDRVIPFRRVRDRTGHPEHHYKGVPITTTVGAALAADRILTDDFYADRVPTIPDDPGWDGHPLYLPDMAVGRLIETPEEIIGQIDRFLADGEIVVGEAAVTGYDVLTDSAQEMCSALLADGLYPNCALIGNSWDATQFHNEILNQRHDLVSYNGHADHHAIYTPRGSVDSKEVSNSTGDHGGSLLWTPGCHGGLNVPPEAAAALDTAQAWAARGALLVGNTGYGWGYTFGIGLSEQLMLNYTRRLLAGTGTTVGRALVEAKQRYYLEELEFDYTDEKILIEATLYGLPMTRVRSPDEGRIAVAAAPSRNSTLERMDGLTVEHVHYDFPALLRQETSQGTYYSYGGQVERNDGLPVQPRAADPLAATLGEPRGAVLRGALGQELADFDPVVEKATWELGVERDEPVFDEPVWSPGLLLRLNRTEEQSNLVLGLGQFQGSRAVQRIYGAMDVDIFYSDAEDEEAPRLQRVESGLQDGVVMLTVQAEDESGIYSVVVAYSDGRDEWERGWASIALLPEGKTWRGGFPARPDTEFFVQVVDGAGNVTAYPWEGRYMRPGDSYYSSRIFLPLVVR